MGAERIEGTIRTLDGGRPPAGALTVRNGRVDAVEGGPRPGPCVLPAFTDAHVHFPSWAVARRELRLFGAGSLEEAVAAVERAEPAADGWIRGRGWRDELWDRRPHRRHLGDRKVALRSQDGHSLWLSSAAVALGLPDLPVVERDESGEPTGILREEAAWAYFAQHAAPGPDAVRAAMRAALPVAAAAGVGGIHDKDGGRAAPERFAELREELTLRVWQSVPLERVAEARALGAGYVKAFMDGTLGSRTALMLDGSGVEITSRDGLAEIVRAAAAHRLPVAVHAIGDLANRHALDAFEATADVWRPLGLRPRIEHAQCVAPEDLPRFARIGVAASVQYTHAISDREIAARVWHDRLDHAYPYRALLDAGALLAGGSDAPVEELDPLAGLAAAVACEVPLEAALASFTGAPAWLSGDEQRRGRLRPGFDADLVVLDRDPVACPPEELAQIPVLATMVGGRWVHDLR